MHRPPRARPRPRSTTSPARPGAPERPSTGTSAASRSWSRRVVRAEAERVTAACHAAAADAATLEDAVVAVLLVAGHEVTQNLALRFLADNECEILLPHLTFAGGDRFLRRRVGGDRALPRAASCTATPSRAAEWVARLGLALWLSPTAPVSLHRRRRAARRTSASSSFLRSDPYLSIPHSPSTRQGGNPDGDHQRGAHRSRRRRRRRGDPRGHEHRRRRGGARGRRRRATRSSRGTTSAAARRCSKLYEKAKTSQWNANDLPWDTDVDQEKVVEREPGAPERRRSVETATSRARRSRTGATRSGSSSAIESQNWTLSQFMHGEQGALICTAQIVETVPVDRRQVLRGDAGDGRGPPRRGVRRATSTRSCRGTTRSTRTCRCCSTTSSPTTAGT